METQEERALLIETAGLGGHAIACLTPGLAATGEILSNDFSSAETAKQLVNALKATLETSATDVGGVGIAYGRSTSYILNYREAIEYAWSVAADRVYIHYQGEWKTGIVADGTEMANLHPLTDVLAALRFGTTLGGLEVQRHLSRMAGAEAVLL